MSDDSRQTPVSAFSFAPAVNLAGALSEYEAAADDEDETKDAHS
jgi:hypothetical protein